MSSNRSVFVENLKVAILLKHHCIARHLESATVSHIVGQEVLWEGEVQIFELAGHERKICYAWASAHQGMTRYVTIIENQLIRSPLEAVKAAIFAGVESAQRTPLFVGGYDSPFPMPHATPANPTPGTAADQDRSHRLSLENEKDRLCN